MTNSQPRSKLTRQIVARVHGMAWQVIPDARVVPMLLGEKPNPDWAGLGVDVVVAYISHEGDQSRLVSAVGQRARFDGAGMLDKAFAQEQMRLRIDGPPLPSTKPVVAGVSGPDLDGICALLRVSTA